MLSFSLSKVLAMGIPNICDVKSELPPQIADSTEAHQVQAQTNLIPQFMWRKAAGINIYKNVFCCCLVGI